MKKHELLEKAMHDYPKGIKFWWPHDTVKNKVTSSGVFEINNSKWIFDKNDRSKAVFNGDNWAEIITEEKPKSILDGKVAIQVNNEREFKLLMEYYESKGWKSQSGRNPKHLTYQDREPYIGFNDAFGYSKYYHIDSGYKIISFEDFAKEIGIEVPNFIMKSVDNVDLYEGDDYHRAYFFDHGDKSIHSKWTYDKVFGLSEQHAVITGRGSAKAFHSKENALKWIDEMNKPKSKTLPLYFGQEAIINFDKSEVRIMDGDREVSTLSFGDINDLSVNIKDGKA